MLGGLFLSYGRDQHVADVLVIKQGLEQHGYKVWFDTERLHAGADWDEDTEQALRECDAVVLVMTPHSVRRRRASEPQSSDGYCLNEIAKAIQLSKPIVPILLAPLADGPPTSICRLHYVDMTGCTPLTTGSKKYEARFAQLLDALRRPEESADGSQARLARYLAPLDYSAEMSRHIARFVGRRWLLDELDAWLASEPQSRAFWIVGGPGIGKSAFATHLCHVRGDVIACHFCTHGNTDRMDARRAILSCLHQIATHIPGYACWLAGAALEEESKKNAQTVLENLLAWPLAALETAGELRAPERPLLIVIDAIDEAAHAGSRNELAEVIGGHGHRLPSWLKFVVTSRPEPEVVAELHAMRGLRPYVLQADNQQNIDDACAFVRAECARLNLAWEPGIVDAMVERSEGVFLYLRVLVEELEAGRASLQRPEEFPRGMAGIYRQFFERQFPDVGLYRERIRAVVAPIIAQRAPLPVELLAAAAEKPRFDIDELLAAMGSLFPIRGDDGQLSVTKLHKSLGDWLIGRDQITGLASAGAYAVDAVLGERMLAEACWREFASAPHAMSRYALQHMLHHLSAADDTVRLELALRDSAYLAGRNAAVTSGAAAIREPQGELPAEQLQRIAELQAKRAAAPEDSTVGFDLGVAYGRLGDWTLAIKELTDAAANMPTKYEPLIDLSLAHTEIGQYEAGVDFAQRALKVYQQHPGSIISNLALIHLALGLALEGMGRNEEAIAAFTQASQIDPTDIDTMLTLGNTHARAKNLDRAAEYYRMVLEREPGNLFARSNLGYTLEEQGDLAGARIQYEKATEHSPTDAIAWYDLGSLLKSDEDRSQAIACFRKAIELDPRHYKACMSLALALEDDGDDAAAVEYYAAALSLTDDEELRDAIRRQLVRHLEIPEDLAACFQPATAWDYARMWLQVKPRHRAESSAAARVRRPLGMDVRAHLDPREKRQAGD